MDENNNPPLAGQNPANPTSTDQPQPTTQAACVKCGGSANSGNCVACNQVEEGCTCPPATTGEDTGQPIPAQ